MNENKEHINVFDHFEVTPPDAVWDRLAQSLAMKKRRKLLLLRLVGGVAAGLLLLIGIHSAWHSPVATPETLSEVIRADNEGLSPAVTAAKETIDAKRSSLRAATMPSVASPQAIALPTVCSHQAFGESHKETEQQHWNTMEGLSAKLRSTIDGAITHRISQAELTRDEQIIRANLALLDKEELDFSPAIGTQYSVFNSLDNTADQSENTLAGGISVTLESNKRFGIQTGIYYAQLEQNSHSSQQIFDRQGLVNSNWGALELATPTQNTSWGHIALATPQAERELVASDGYRDELASNKMNSSTTIAQRAAYLEIPLIMRYTLIDKRVGLEVLGGFNNSFLVNNKANYTQDGERLNAKTADLKGYNGNSVAGIALNYSITKQLNFGIEPKMKYYFNGLSENADVDFRPVVFGVYTGLSYHF